MKIEINENPGERNNSSQVGSNASEEKKKIVSYIEVVPSLPRYHIGDYEILKVLKMLFVPEEKRPAKLIVESNSGFVEVIDWTRNEEDFSTIQDHQDTVESGQLEPFLFMCNFDVDRAVKDLAEWGITKISFRDETDKIVSTNAFFEAYKTFVLNKAKELIIKCEDGKELRFPYNTNYALKEKS